MTDPIQPMNAPTGNPTKQPDYRRLDQILLVIMGICCVGLIVYMLGSFHAAITRPPEPVFPTCSRDYSPVCWDGEREDEVLVVDCDADLYVRCDDDGR